MHLCAIALHRFLGISYPLHFRSQQNKRHVIALLLPTWTVSFAISVPLVIQGLYRTEYVLMVDPYGRPQCGIFDHIFVVYSSMVSFFVPLVIMVIADIRSVQVLRKSSTSSGNNTLPRKHTLRRSKSCRSTMCSSVDPSSSTYSVLPSRQLTKSRSLWSGDSFRLTDTPPTSQGSLIGHMKEDSSETFITKNHEHSSSDNVHYHKRVTQKHSYEGGLHRHVTSGEIDFQILSAGRQTPLLKSHPENSTDGNRKMGYVGMLATRGLQKLNSRERRAERTLIWVFVCFVVLWLPFFCTNLTYGLCKACNISPKLFLAFTWLGYISSGVNPCIYTLLNRDFRNAFSGILLCRFYRRPSLARKGTIQRFNME